MIEVITYNVSLLVLAVIAAIVLRLIGVVWLWAGEGLLVVTLGVLLLKIRRRSRPRSLWWVIRGDR